jgi:hypothetical protein
MVDAQLTENSSRHRIPVIVKQTVHKAVVTDAIVYVVVEPQRSTWLRWPQDCTRCRASTLYDAYQGRLPSQPRTFVSNIFLDPQMRLW